MRMGHIDNHGLCEYSEPSGHKACVSTKEDVVPVFASHDQVFALGIHHTANMSAISVSYRFQHTYFIKLHKMLQWMEEEKHHKMTHYGMNIGANDGKTLGPDPMYHVFDAKKLNYKGICVEPDTVAFSKLRKNLPDERIKKVNMAMTPRLPPSPPPRLPA